jgi:hypothetical protein
VKQRQAQVTESRTTLNHEDLLVKQSTHIPMTPINIRIGLGEFPQEG